MKRLNKLVASVVVLAVLLVSVVMPCYAATISKSYQLFTNTGAAETTTAYKVGTSAQASANNSSSATTNANILLRRSVGGSVTKVASAIATPGSSATTAKISYSGSSDATWAAVAAPGAKAGSGTYFCSGTLKLTTY